MNRHESKYLNTARTMNDALISLLEIKDIDYITVKEVCKRAGLNRSTFYLHYEDMSDLVAETMKHTLDKFASYFKESAESFVVKIKYGSLDDLKLINEKYLTPYLTFIKENRRIFKVSFSSPEVASSFQKYHSLEKHIFVPILERFSVPGQEQPYLLEFYLHGIMAIIKTWVANDCQDDITVIQNTIMKCVK